MREKVLTRIDKSRSLLLFGILGLVYINGYMMYNQKFIIKKISENPKTQLQGYTKDDLAEAK